MPKAVIFGCATTTLSDAEGEFFAASNPLGFILFARNCDSPDQVRELVRALRQAVGREDAPVLIDQEGGRVTRLRAPHWRHPPAAGVIGALYRRNHEAGVEVARLNARLIAADLHALGIDIDCLPVLDVPVADGSQVVGDRAFTNDPAANAALGRAACEGLLDGGVLPVLKHMPGHGRAMVDSHNQLPVVDTSLAELRAVDFVPFRALADFPAGMMAHVLFRAIDPANPASTSRIVIDRIIRGEIGFDGLLLSDDIGMSALGGDIAARAARVVAAGCDLAVHCSGKLDEMQAVSQAVGALEPATLQRLERTRSFKRQPAAFDQALAMRVVDDLLAKGTMA
jgi:beta-N-acetylhexosaminidase